MSVRNIFIVYVKELIDSLRDRRTLISMVVVPVLIMPVMVLGMGMLTAKVVSTAKKEVPKVMILGGEQSPKIMAALGTLETLKLVPYQADYTNMISDKRIRAALQIPHDFDAALERGEDAMARIYEYGGDMKSGFAVQAVDKFLRDWRETIVRERLTSRNLPETLTRPFRIERENVAPPNKVAGNLLGGLLPYMVILLCMTGGMYPAMDLTAGEKERGTMETLLCSPAGRIDLVLGKFLMVMTASITTAILALGSMAATYLIAKSSMDSVLPSRPGSLALAVDPTSVLMVFAMILPVTVLLSAAQLAISVFARSFKEAQSYLTPLMFAVIIPAVASMTPGIELNLKLALIPILNTSLVCKEIMAGNLQWNFIALIFFSTCAYAALSLVLAMKLFQRESVIMRT